MHPHSISLVVYFEGCFNVFHEHHMILKRQRLVRLNWRSSARLVHIIIDGVKHSWVDTKASHQVWNSCHPQPPNYIKYKNAIFSRKFSSISILTLKHKVWMEIEENFLEKIAFWRSWVEVWRMNILLLLNDMHVKNVDKESDHFFLGAQICWVYWLSYYRNSLFMASSFHFLGHGSIRYASMLTMSTTLHSWWLKIISRLWSANYTRHCLHFIGVEFDIDMRKQYTKGELRDLSIFHTPHMSYSSTMTSTLVPRIQVWNQVRGHKFIVTRWKGQY